MKKILITLSLFAFLFNASAQKIACGEAHSLAICTDSTVWAWGANNRGQLGNGTFDSSNTPVQVHGLTGIVHVACGSDFSFAIKSDGSLWGWGRNDAYQLGIDTLVSDQNIAVKINGISNVNKVYGHGKPEGQLWNAGAYAITTDGSLWGWGMPFTSLFGDSGKLFSTSPTKDTVLQNVKAVGGGGGGGYSAYLVLLEDGTVWAWGSNFFGQLGVGSNPPNYRGTYVQVKNLNNVKSLSSSLYTLSVKSDGSLWAWGLNSQGQLGDSTYINRFEPVEIKGIGKTRSVVISGYNSSYALTDNNILWSWGSNDMGQLGDGTTNTRNYPSPINGLNNVMEVAAGGDAFGGHALAVNSDGKLWAWGYNNKGQLGDGTLIDRHTPIQVQGLCEILVSVPQITLNTTEYKIYPNPATDILHIDFTTVTPNKIEIQDIHGRTLYSQSVSSAQSTHEISLANFSGGVYFVKLYSETGVVLKKIIKN